MLGKEIQKLRRSRGLSQEKLAEQMEVSRQAISKWESGAAVPEVEKLIQLARLFGVSVDRLLGLEPPEGEAPPAGEEEGEERAETGAPEPRPAASAAPPEAAPAGSAPPDVAEDGERFRVLEGMVAELAREQHLRERRQRRRGLLRGAALLCALGAAAIAAGEKISAMEGQVRGLWSGLDNLSRNLTSQVDSIAGQVREGLEEQASLAAAYEVRFLEADLEARTALFRLSVTPKTWKEGMEVQFQLARDGRTTLLPAAAGEGTSFVAEAAVPWGGDTALSAVFTDPESGERRTQALDTIRDPEADLSLDVSSGFYGTVSVPGDGTVRFRGKVELWCDFYPTYIDGTLLAENYPVSAWALVLVDGAEADRAALELRNNAPGGEGDWNSNTALDFDREYSLAPGQTLELLVEVTDALGQTTRQVTNTYAADAQGTIRPVD